MKCARAQRRGQSEARSGITMVELVVAIGVLLVAVMSAFSSQVTSMNLVHQSRTTTTAIVDLEACMESLLIMPAAQLPLAGSPYEHNQSVARFEDKSLPDERIVASYPGYTPGGNVPDPLPIVLTARWTDPRGGQRTLTLRSMKTR